MQTDVLGKQLGEMVRIFIPDRPRDGADRMVRANKLPLGVRHAAADLIIDWRDAEFGREQMRQMACAHVELRGQLLNLDRRTIVFVDIILSFLGLP